MKESNEVKENERKRTCTESGLLARNILGAVCMMRLALGYVSKGLQLDTSREDEG